MCGVVTLVIKLVLKKFFPNMLNNIYLIRGIISRLVFEMTYPS